MCKARVNIQMAPLVQGYSGCKKPDIFSNRVYPLECLLLRFSGLVCKVGMKIDNDNIENQERCQYFFFICCGTSKHQELL